MEINQKSMAIQTKSHTKMFFMAYLFHQIHAPMTLNTTHAAVNMHRMIKIYIVWQLVNLHPLDRFFLILVAGSHRLQSGIIGTYSAVAVHTGVGSWHIRVPRLINPIMAIAAIKPQLVNMNRMRKRYRLSRLITDPRILGREIIGQTGCDCPPNDQKAK